MPESPGDLDLLRAYLRERDVTCPVCGHNLRGAASFACPECGGRLDLHVVSMDMPHKWWIMRLVAFAWPLGLLATFAGAGTWAFAHQRLWQDEPLLLAGCWAALIVDLTGLLATMRTRTRFVQLALARQRATAIACTFVSLTVVLALLYAFVRIESYW